MNRLKFPLSSDQLELLLAFEKTNGLGRLAEVMAKDPSVISRNLQKIAEDLPVLIKIKGRWELTPLGLQINQQTRTYLQDLKNLASPFAEYKKPKSIIFDDRSILIIINAQNGLFDRTQEDLNNSEAEVNIARLLHDWRSKNRKVIHVKHVSDNPKSIFFKNLDGCHFLKMAEPMAHETVIEKTKSSAFADTSLIDVLNNQGCTKVILVGFTANDCIDATAKDATGLGLDTFVSSDATATFDLRDATGKLVKANRIHRLTLLNINAFSAKVMTTGEILSSASIF